MNSRLRQQKIFLLHVNALYATILLLLTTLLSGTAYAHEHRHDSTTQQTNHKNYDAFIAAMVRAEEQSGQALLKSYLNQTLAKLPIKLLLSELVDAAVGKQLNAAVGGNPALYGEWSGVTKWPIVFASAANLPDGRILAWGGNAPTYFSGGTYTYATIWNPANGQFINVNHPSHSLFCGIPVMLEDGRVFVDGGDNGNASSVKGTSTFDYKTQAWTRIQDLAVGRWYNGSVALPNGKVFSALGDPGSAYPELWTQGVGWSYLNGISFQAPVLDFPTITEARHWLPHMHLAPNGKIFHSGHTPKMHNIDLTGNGSIEFAGLINDWNTANTPSVFYDEGKILQSGGALYATGNPASVRSKILDISANTSTKTGTGNMQFTRIFHNEVVLPNGEVMAIGGNNGIKFSDQDSQLTPEIWSPLTNSWRQVADIAVGRNYHSVALLMSDGRVFSGGGGLCGCSADHPDSQIYSPAYLFNADGSLATRPEIMSAPNLVSYGRTINVAATPGINKFSLVRMSATTHALNSDLRFLNVPFITINNNGDYVLTLHTNPNVMTPGFWMLFALDAKGVPSVAKVIQVTTSGVPTLRNPGDQSTLLNANSNLTIQATDPNGDFLSYSAIGLPQGLSMNANTGQITGVASSAVTTRVIISVTDGTHTVTTNFNWTIVGQITPIASPLSGATTVANFTDTVATSQSLVGVTVRAGWWLDGIQGILNTGALPIHGGTGGNVYDVTWPANEYLVRIYGLYGSYIGQISFVTNTGRILGPYGTANGGNNTNSFDFTIPAGNEIIGFTGNSDTYLNGVGVVYRSIQSTNQPPVVATVADQQNIQGASVNLAISATDADNHSLTYSAVGLPPGLSISSSTGVISGTITAAGNYDVIVKVTDARGAIGAVNFGWGVAPAALVFNPITTTPKAINTAVTLSASVSNGLNPRYKWSFGDGTPETSYTATASINHSFSAPGLYVVRVTVIDDHGLTSTTTFTQAIHRPLTTARPAISSNLAVTQVNNGNQLWVVNQDNDSVSVFNADSNTKLAEIAVGRAPRSIAVAPDGRIWVSNKLDSTLSVLNSTTLQVVQTIQLPFAAQPFGLAFAPNGSAAYVVLEGSGQLLKLNPSSGSQLAMLNVGQNPRHVAVQADSNQVFVSRFITPPLPGESTASVQTVVNNANVGGEVLAINPATMTISKTIALQYSDSQDSSTSGAGIPNYLAMPTISPDGLTLWIPSKKDNIKRGTLRNGNNLNFQNTVRAIASNINIPTLTENYQARLDLDNSGQASAAVFNPTGNYLFVTLETTREVVIVDAYGAREISRIPVGRAPDGLATSLDGTKLFVNNFMDRSVSVIDLTNLLAGREGIPSESVQLKAVGTEKLAANVLKGKQLFYDAKDTRLARDGYISCVVCHNDGSHDGRVWDFTGFGEGLRNTINLQGRKGMGHGSLHWTGNFDEIQDFEGQIRSLAGGTGLMTDANFTATQSPLGNPKTGLSSDLDALAAYVNSLTTVQNSPYRNADGSLTTDAIAGKSLFSSANCTQCHGGSDFTDSPSKLLHSMPTIKPTSGQRLNAPLTGLDTPTLRDVWATAPYLHDGSAATLELAISAHANVTLTTGQIAQVSAYIRQLGALESVPINAAPTVTLTAPANASSAKVGTAVNLVANANDADGTVVKVEFYVDSATLLGTVTSSPYTLSVSNLTQGSHVLTAKAYDNGGAVTTSSPVNISIQADGQGLVGQYYNNINLSGTPVLSRLEKVDFNWGSGSPSPTVNADNFSVRWMGEIEVPTSGAYQFQTVSDDGVRLFVNGQQLINNWTVHAPTIDTSTTVNLVAGNRYKIVLEYYENNYGAIVKVLWKTPGQTAFDIIPTSSLFAQGLSGQYFNNVNLTGTPVYTNLETVDFAWGSGAPSPTVPADYFSVRWIGEIQATDTGAYQFQTLSDDGVRLFVNDQQLINNWTLHGPTTDTSATINLVAGNRYKIVMEYFENYGGTAAKLSWLPPGQTAFAAISANNLFPVF